ncbi:MAG: NADase-type glycan-binding domain-containing protein [Actinomycetes bacterium]
MSDTNRPGDVPPDLPPEYAEAYLRGYQRARRDSPEVPGDDVPGDDLAERTQVSGPLFADEPPAAGRHELGAEAEPTRRLSTLGLGEPEPTVATPYAPLADLGADQGGPAGEPYDDGYDRYEERDRPTWLVPVLLGVAALVLIGAAFFIGKMVAGSLASTGQAAAQNTPDHVVMGDGSGSSSGAPKHHRAKGAVYHGATDAVAIRRASATCESPPAVDASGRTVRYAPRNVADGDFTTAWRCDGDGVGQRLTLQLPAGTSVGSVGLVPGYAKTDPTSGADRYAENDRITKVRWIFEDGTTVIQRFDGSPRNRSMQTMRIPVTRSGQVVVEILASTPGPRHTVAISEVRIGRTR